MTDNAFSGAWPAISKKLSDTAGHQLGAETCSFVTLHEMPPHDFPTSAEDMEAMVRSLTCRELAEAHLGGALGKVLARLGVAIDAVSDRQERESQTDTQPLPDSLRTREYGVDLDGPHLNV